MSTRRVAARSVRAVSPAHSADRGTSVGQLGKVIRSSPHPRPGDKGNDSEAEAEQNRWPELRIGAQVVRDGEQGDHDEHERNRLADAYP